MIRELNLISYKEQIKGLEILSPREKTVASLVILGYSNEEIGQMLGVTHHTVKAHVAKILRKTQTINRCRLAYLIGSYKYRTEFAKNPEVKKLIYQNN